MVSRLSGKYTVSIISSRAVARYGARARPSEIGEEKFNYFPFEISEETKPVYRNFQGWKADITKLTDKDNLPLELLQPGFVPEPYARGADIRDINKRIASFDFSQAIRNL